MRGWLRGVAGIVATVRDVTERKAFENQLAQKAFYDSLTGLPNRALFRDRLDQAFARAERRDGSVGLLFLDLDNFKQINDGLGHDIGDQLLVEASTRLQACVREENTVARLGGDEFVILLEYLTSEADAVLVADRIAQHFVQPFRLGGRDLHVTVSVGIALGNDGHDLADNILRNADVAMYRAKSNGKGRYAIFDATMQDNTLARLELENDLRTAVERNELRVHYQPIVFLATGHVAGVEALVCDGPGHRRSKGEEGSGTGGKACVLFAWIITKDPAECPGKFVARLATSHPTVYVMQADTLAELQAMLPPDLKRSERQPADLPEVVEIWFSK